MALEAVNTPESEHPEAPDVEVMRYNGDIGHH